MDTGVLSRIKRQGREVDHSIPFSVEVKNEQGHSYALQTSHYSMDRNIFTVLPF
jgi:hypothetical protein